MTDRPQDPAAVLALAEEARSRIRGAVRETPTERSPRLSQAFGVDLHLKLEQLQHTGSFKCRGAMNAVLALPEAARRRGVVAASTGNHGMAVAFAAARAGCAARIFVPVTASVGKIAGIRALGGEAVLVEGGCLDAEAAARRAAEATGQAFISPYNDALVLAGQGTLALELLQQVEGLDAVYVSVGGGGLLSGVGGVIKALRPSIQVVACQPLASCVMYQSVKAGRILDAPEDPTLSDGTAGGVETDAITFDLVRQVVDRWALVEEKEIASALRRLFEADRWLVEGAAAVALAAALAEAPSMAGRRVGVVLCGRNIDAPAAAHVLLG